MYLGYYVEFSPKLKKLKNIGQTFFSKIYEKV